MLHQAKPYTFAELDADGNGDINGEDANYLSLVNIGSLYFITGLNYSSVSPGDCLFTIGVTLEGKAGARVSVADTIVLLDIAHTDEAFQSEVEASVVTTGAVATYDKGSALLYGGIYVADMADAQTGYYELSMGAAFNRSDIGISVIQISRDSLYTSMLMFTGSQSTSLLYSAKVSTTVSAFGSEVSVLSGGKQGYNPVLFAGNLAPSLDCFESIPCASTEYRHDAATIISAPNCVAATVCTPLQFQSVAPTPTTNRVCSLPTQCASYQYEEVPYSKTSDRVCTNATVCFDVVAQAIWINATLAKHNFTSVANLSQYNISIPELEFEMYAPSYSTDRNCTIVTNCSASLLIERTPPTITSDRTCKSKFSFISILCSMFMIFQVKLQQM